MVGKDTQGWVEFFDFFLPLTQDIEADNNSGTVRNVNTEVNHSQSALCVSLFSISGIPWV